jgi:hypothetical protein
LTFSGFADKKVGGSVDADNIVGDTRAATSPDRSPQLCVSLLARGRSAHRPHAATRPEDASLSADHLVGEVCAADINVGKKNCRSETGASEGDPPAPQDRRQYCRQYPLSRQKCRREENTDA